MESLIAMLFVTLLIAGTTLSSGIETLTNGTGDVSAPPGGEVSFRILVPKGKKIIISVSNLHLDFDGYFKLQDGIGGKVRMFKKMGFGIYEVSENGGLLGSVIEPLQMITSTRKLFIDYKSEKGNGFSGHYTSFNPNQGCKKNEILADGQNMTDLHCDADPLSPVASQCRVTLDCGPHHIQYNNSITCEGGEWRGIFDCKPRRELIDNCVFDFDNVTDHQETNVTCLYTPEEIARYYIDVENVVVSNSTSLGKSANRIVGCRNVCNIFRNGHYVVSCNNAKNRGRLFRCMVCRLIHKCQFGSVFF